MSLLIVLVSLPCMFFIQFGFTTFDISFSTLEAIKAFICKQQGRKYISRMLTYAGDGYNLRKLNNRLDNDLALFGVCTFSSKHSLRPEFPI